MARAVSVLQGYWQTEPCSASIARVDAASVHVRLGNDVSSPPDHAVLGVDWATATAHRQVFT